MNTPDADVLRRHFVAIATSAHDDPRCVALPGVVDEVKTLQNWLCDEHLGDRAFIHRHPQLAANPTRQQVREVFEDPAQRWNHSDAAVVFVTGHGVSGNGTHWMVLEKTDTGRLRSTANDSSLDRGPWRISR